MMSNFIKNHKHNNAAHKTVKIYCSGKQYTSAFSLIELSIVLVIMGLLVGGIIGGKALMDSSKIIALSSELNQFTVAINAFNSKYDAYPGDYEHASQRISSNLEDGNGDGYIGYYDPDDLASLENWSFILDSDKTAESRMFFAHLFASKILSRNIVEEGIETTKITDGLSLLLPVAHANSSSLSDRMMDGYYRSKPFPEAVLFPRVDAGSNYLNAVNSLTLVNSNALDAALKTNSVDVIKLTSVLPSKTLLKLKHKLSEDSNCQNGDCLVSGNVYIRSFSVAETNGLTKGDSCLARNEKESKTDQQLVLNLSPKQRKCTIGYSVLGSGEQLTLREDIPIDRQPGADVSKCYHAPESTGVSWNNAIIIDGGTITGTCSIGYSLPSGQTTPSATCSNGSWTNIVNNCLANCGSLPAIEGIVWNSSDADTANDTTVSGACATGYSLPAGQAVPSITCSNSNWTNIVNNCFHGCANPPVLANVNSSSWSKTNAAIGASVTGNCNPGYGYILRRASSGNSNVGAKLITATCTPEATWSFNHACDQQGCDLNNTSIFPVNGKNFQNSGWKSYIGNITRDEGNDYTMVLKDNWGQANCNPGYYANHPKDVRRGSTFSLCTGVNATNNFDNNGFSNVCVKGCPAAPSMAYASLSYNYNASQYNAVYPVGAVATYTCSPGYGSKVTKTCQSDGTWQGTDICRISGYREFTNKAVFTVPSNVSSVKLYVWGSKGGVSKTGRAGGNGGYTTATMTVTPGQQLQIWTGGSSTGNGDCGGGHNEIGENFGGCFSSIVTDYNAKRGSVVGVIAGGGGGAGDNYYGEAGGGGNSCAGTKRSGCSGTAGVGVGAGQTRAGDSGMSSSGAKGGAGGGGGGTGVWVSWVAGTTSGGGGGGGGYGGGSGGEDNRFAGGGGGGFCGDKNPGNGGVISDCSGKAGFWNNIKGKAAIAWGNSYCNQDGSCSD